MYPWIWFWAPQVHYPWSGGVSQNIHPNTAWFSDLIQASAGNAKIEQQAFSVASYGKQLGLITEVLISVAEQTQPLSPEAADSLARLRTIKSAIDAIKESESSHVAMRLAAEVRSIRDRGGKEFERLSEALLPLLSESKT